MAFSNGRGSGASDVAHAWAHQTKDGKKDGNVFFEGDTIYSYGYHFPMAKLLKDEYVAITTKTYSNTTSAHLGRVRGAVSHKHIIYCKEIPTHGNPFTWAEHECNIEEWIAEIKEALRAHIKARKKEKHVQTIEGIRQSVKEYVDYFKLKLKKEQKDFIFSTDIEGYQDALIKAADLEMKRQQALVKKGRKLHPIWLESFRSFTTTLEFQKEHNVSAGLWKAIQSVEMEGRDANHVRLRADTSTVYTSKGVDIPVDIAHRYYKKYLTIVAKGGCTGDCNYKIMEFDVKEMNDKHLLVGCHDILREDIDYIAGTLGWIK